MERIELQELEQIKNEIIENMIEVFTRDTLGRNSDMILNDLYQKDISNLLGEKELKELIENIALLKVENKEVNTHNYVKSYLLPRIMSKVIPTNVLVTETPLEKDYADFTQVGFTEYCSKFFASETNIPYQVPDNHQANLEFVESMVSEMKKFPKEFSTKIFKSIFHYNINQLEMQFSSFAPSKNFLDSFETKYVYTSKLEKIKNLLNKDFEDKELLEIIKTIKKHKKIEYAELYLQKKYLEKYKDNMDIYEQKISQIADALHGKNTSSAQSKANASTRVLAKTGSIKGLVIFVFSVLFALVLAYFLSK